ncbi:hypothetical protein OSTOST_10638, partial [Ostertagia ostertagi]
MYCYQICGAIVIWCVLAIRGDDESGEYGEFEDEFRLDVPPDYSRINVSDAAWNITLMRYLNFKENDMQRNLDTSICHRLSNRFAPKSVPPSGFCELQNGPGPHNFLVLGNNYAMNLGPIVYDTFKEHAKEFNIFSLKGCDTMVKHQRPTCKDNVNYTDLLQTLKPNVIFVLRKIYILQAVPSLNREKYYLTYAVTPIRKIK